MKQLTCLFIGGAQDGLRIATDVTLTGVMIPVPGGSTINRTEFGIGLMETELYRRVELRDVQGDYYVYVHGNIDRTVEYLIDGYAGAK